MILWITCILINVFYLRFIIRGAALDSGKYKQANRISLCQCKLVIIIRHCLFFPQQPECERRTKPRTQISEVPSYCFHVNYLTTHKHNSLNFYFLSQFQNIYSSKKKSLNLNVGNLNLNKYLKICISLRHFIMCF